MANNLIFHLKELLTDRSARWTIGQLAILSSGIFNHWPNTIK